MKDKDGFVTTQTTMMYQSVDDNLLLKLLLDLLIWAELKESEKYLEIGGGKFFVSVCAYAACLSYHVICLLEGYVQQP